ncbi:TPM domain-containing protein [Salinibacterium sp. SWN248]|uniref:TPM domain-containing protein n=1 Tax=Salinibacterium sp. SWN248 TaxID=2792056 RepID=UPI0018CE6610|nr:TPM domain-containing protein [Salinibacterium sp. SWN248]MBH0025180.1 TPM domain-containing protein [Salinibacterium sp. SWN248]
MKARLGTVFALAAALALLTATPALADDPVSLDGAYVVDSAGVLAGDSGDVTDALDLLYDRAGIQLFVVYVDEFTNPSSPIDWADATAEANGLGDDDLLLAVAVSQRQYALSVSADAPLTDVQLDAAEAAIESQLRDDNWGQAAIAGADSLASDSAAGSGTGSDSGTGTESGTTESSSGGISVLPILGGVAVIGVGAYAFYRVRRRGNTGAAAGAPVESVSQEELDRRAGSALVELDDALKTSEQELGFAEAQFGAQATTNFAASLKEASAAVAQAFRIRQKLDDSEPETAEQKRAMTIEIIGLCERADDLLDAQAAAFDELRKLETNAPAALAETSTLIAKASERLPATESALEALRGRYAPVAIEAVTDNGERARALLASAVADSTAASAAIEAQKPSEAAVGVRTAQAELGQAIQLMDAVDSLATELQSAETQLAATITDTTGDIAAARALPSDATAGALQPAIAAAEAALATAQSSTDNPVASLSTLGDANAALETVFVGVRDQQAAFAHAATQLSAALAAAQSRITTTAQFITTRRGGVGATARTRISEADRQFKQALALQTSDPVTALTHARQADQLAASAYDLAQREVSQFSTGSSSGSGMLGGLGGAVGGSGGGDLLGGIIGGLIGGSLGSRSSRPSSGGSWGGGSRSGGFSGGGGRRSGGSSGRSGGGRSRGGRF